MAMHNPSHPGGFITDIYLEPNGISGRELAEKFNVAASTLSSIFNGSSQITPEMALRLSKAIGRSPESWLAMQDALDLWMARQHIDLHGVGKPGSFALDATTDVPADFMTEADRAQPKNDRDPFDDGIADGSAGHVTERFGSVSELLADLNADDTPDIQQGCANVYAGLGHSGTDEMLIKARLVTKIGEVIKARPLSAEQAATVLGMTPAELRELLTGRFQAHRVDELERLASMLDEPNR